MYNINKVYFSLYSNFYMNLKYTKYSIHFIKNNILLKLLVLFYYLFLVISLYELIIHQYLQKLEKLPLDNSHLLFLY
jgi:hypothetical protein